MNPLKRIYLERGPAAKRLAGSLDVTSEQRAELLRAIAETEALTDLNDTAIPPPARERVLEAAYSKAGVIQQDEEDRKMNPLYTLFTGKRWATRLAIGAALALVILACLTVTLVPRPQGGGYCLEPAQPALAAQPGYLLAAFTDAKDEQQAREAAEQLASMARELIELKQVEMEKIQVMLDELIAELDANQELVDRKIAGQELSKREQEKLDQLEKRLIAKAGELRKKGEKLQEVAGILSDKERLVRQKAELLRSNIGDVVIAESAVTITSEVVEGEDGEYQITIAMPGLSPDLADELRVKLESIPELKDIKLDGVSFIVTENDVEGSDDLREITITTGDPNDESIARVLQSKITSAEIGDVELKEVDGQLAVSIVGNDGQVYVFDDDNIDMRDGEFKLKTYVKGEELDMEELDDMYNMIVAECIVMTDDGETYSITMPSDMDTTQVTITKQGDEITTDVTALGQVYLNADDGVVISSKNGDETGGVTLQSVIVQSAGEGLSDEELKELLEEEGISFDDHVPGTITIGTAEGDVNGEPGELKLKTFKLLSSGEELDSEELQKLLEEAGVDLEESEAMAFTVCEGGVKSFFGENSLVISLEDGEAGGEDGATKFGWLDDEKLGNFVFIGSENDEFRIVHEKNMTVLIGDPEPFQPELNEVTAYINKHYAGKEAGFKAVGSEGKLEVKLLIDGEVVETLETERSAAGDVVLTHIN